MPYLVQYLIEGRADPVYVRPIETAEKALALMIEHDFSQLPVIDETERPMGMVTQESVLRALSNFGINLDQLLVDDALVKAATSHPDDDLFDLLDRLRDTNAVLIVDRENILIGIVTGYDSTEYFRRRAEDIMLVEDIESMIKELIQSAYLDNSGDIDQSKLLGAIEIITSSNTELKKKYKQALIEYVKLRGYAESQLDIKALEESFYYLIPKVTIKEFEQLTLAEYIALLLHPDHWDYYAPTLNIDRNAMEKLLSDVRETRNNLAHFRGDVSATQRDRLKFTVDWFDRHRAYPISWPVFVEEDDSRRPQQIKEESEEYLERLSGEDIIPTEEDLSPKESRYAQLAIWLLSRPGNEDRVQLSFKDVEIIIGGELPKSARIHRAWWANDSVGHSQSQQWLDAGWRSTYINLTEEKVTFARIAEREKAYILFFGDLLVKLRKRADFQIKDVSPDGKNWIVIKALPENGSQQIVFAYSFARGKRFRIEFYIDTGKKEKNKAIFDELYSHKTAIEQSLNFAVSWERIDNKRASRLALYHDGSIGDDQSKLENLRDWAVESMIRFYNTLNEPAEKALAKER